MTEKLKQAYEDLCIKSDIYKKASVSVSNPDCNERIAYLRASFETFLLLRDYLGCHHSDVIFSQEEVCYSFMQCTDHDIIDIVKKHIDNYIYNIVIFRYS